MNSIFSYALNTLPFHYLGHLPILPGPFHFYDNEKMEETTIQQEVDDKKMPKSENITETTILDFLIQDF